MSLKDDIDMVKQELNSEEKFFEKAVITEKFVKKYKNLLIGSVVAIIAIVVVNVVLDINKQNTITSANAALATLSKDATDSAAIKELKESSPELYDVWLFSNAMANKDLATLNELKNSKALFVKDLASYELAQDKQDVKELNTYSLNQDAIFRDLALVQAAILLLNDNKIDDAREKLSSISADSSLAKLVHSLLHYGVK